MSKNSNNSILYVDDEVNSLDVFRLYFENTYNVYVAQNTKEAEELLRTVPVKVLISDYYMPGESGIDFIQRMNPLYPDVVKIMFSAFVDREIILGALNKASVYRYITKPWNANEIRLAIDSAIREYDLKHENQYLFEELRVKNSELYDTLQSLKQSEGKIRKVIENADEGIFFINDEKQIIDVNPAFFKMLGMEALNGQFSLLTREIENRIPVLLNLPKEIASREVERYKEIEFNDGAKVKYFEISSSYADAENKDIIVSLVKDFTEKKLVDKKLLDAIIHTQEEDQKRYARELHDGLGPILSTLKMHLEWMNNPEQPVNKDKIIQHSIKTVNEAVNTVKEIANNLSPHVLQKFGLAYAISTYINKIGLNPNVEISFHTNLKEQVNETIETDLYRIVLECLNNSLKHAKCSSVLIKLKKYEHSLFLGFMDNGKGFDIAKVRESNNGMGLYNIINRIRHLNGKYKMISKPNQGFILTSLINC
ncbi:MAG TPA: response regulator [Bacteroidales bacterium]